MNVLLTSVVSGVVLIESLAAGYNRYLSLALSIFCAVVTCLYIMFNHKIKEYVSVKEVQEEQDEE